MKKPTHIDLFSGAGGFSLAAKWAGFKTIGHSEIDPFCCKVLAKNFPDIKNYGDIKDIITPIAANLITAAMPCQFSQGKPGGVDDERYMWPILRGFINSVRPDWAIIEDVPGIVSMEFDNIITDLETQGYKCSPYILPACGAGAPHRRDRVWIVAHHNSIGGNSLQRDRQRRHIQANFERNLAKTQSKWHRLKPDAWATYTARDWLAYNTAASRDDDGLSKKLDLDRIKALGNAIVPQVIYPVLQFIYDTYQIPTTD